MRSLFFLLFISFSAIAFGQDNFPTRLDNKKTFSHTNIMGTKVYLIMPKGFSAATNYAGVSRDDNTIITLMDLDGMAFDTYVKSFDKEKMAEKGGKLLDYQDVVANGFKARYIKMTNQDKIISTLVVGDSSFCVMLIGSNLESDKEGEQLINQSLASFVYDKQLKVDPMAGANFTLDDSKGKLKLAKAVPPMYMYSLDGKMDSGDSDPLLIAVTMPNTGSSAEAMQQLMLNSLESKGFTDIDSKRKSNAKVNGYDASEVEAYATIKGKKQMIYLLVVLHNDKAVIFEGFGGNETASVLPQLKQLAYSIKFK